MTLIVVTKRPDFAVLAADRFHGGAGQSYAPKVVWHPDPAIPLAFAIGGQSHLLLRGKQAPATEHLLPFAQQITPDELELAAIDRRLKELILPGVKEKQGEARVYIALVRNGKAAVGFRNFKFQAGDVLTDFCEECRHFCPDQIEAAFQPNDWESLHDPTVTDAALVIRQARLLIDKGVAYDKKLHGGVPGSCDGPAEVMDCSPKSGPGAMRVSEALRGQETNHETTHGRRDHPQAAPSRGRPGPRLDHRSGLPTPRHQ